jgi:hypothetical protein
MAIDEVRMQRVTKTIPILSTIPSVWIMRNIINPMRTIKIGTRKPHAPELRRNLQLSTKGREPEIDKASPRAEISAKPSSSKGSNDHQAGKDQQEEVAQLGIKYAANGYY